MTSHSNSVPTDLARLGFAAGRTSREHISLSVCSCGQEGTGKTEWACRGPQPVTLITFDPGTERIVTKLRKEGIEIYESIVEIPKPKSLRGVKGKDKERAEAANKKLFSPIWDGVLEQLWGVEKCPSMSGGTLVCDTATELRELARLAILGGLTNIGSFSYGDVNDVLRPVMKALVNRTDLHSVWIHKMGKKYAKKPGEKESSWTGEWERRGFDDIRYFCDLVSEHRFDKGKPAQGKNGFDERFGLRVDVNKEWMEMSGRTLWGEGATFEEVLYETFGEEECDGQEWRFG
jgi:hypothetical protein